MATKRDFGIDPNRGYNIVEFAEFIDQSPGWIKRELVRPGKIKFCDFGTRLTFPGWVITNYMENNLKQWGDDDHHDGRVRKGPPGSTRSRSSSSRADETSS